MARQNRLKLDPRQPAYYHVWSKVVQGLFLMIAPEDKLYFLKLLQLLARTFFVKLFSYQIMDNHFHLVLEISIPPDLTREQIVARFENLYPHKKFNPEEASEYMAQWSDISVFMKYLNQQFAVYFNRKQKTSGHFWGGRFKSTILADMDAVLNCMAYVELNATRAGMVSRSEDYAYSSMSYVIKQHNLQNLVDVQAISTMFSGLHIDPEQEREIQQEIGSGISYLPSEQQVGYVKYIAFVRMKQQSGFLKSVRSFCRQAILGKHSCIQAIASCLQKLGKIRYYDAFIPGVDSNLAFC